MEDYIVSARSLVYKKKGFLPGEYGDENYLKDRLQIGATLISELREELENFAAIFILLNQPISNQEIRLLKCINNELMHSFISSI